MDPKGEDNLVYVHSSMSHIQKRQDTKGESTLWGIRDAHDPLNDDGGLLNWQSRVVS